MKVSIKALYQSCTEASIQPLYQTNIYGGNYRDIIPVRYGDVYTVVTAERFGGVYIAIIRVIYGGV
jgi:hypothetical protein